MSFKELSAWATVLIMIAVYGFYFFHLLPGADGGQVIALLTQMIVIVVVLEIVMSVALAILHRPERTDERDRLISAKAYRNAYFALVLGVLAAVMLGLMPSVASSVPIISQLPEELRTAHVLVLGLVVATLVHYGSLIGYYRAGA